MKQYQYDVFLSYSSADKDIVIRVAGQLRDAGLKVWFDKWIIEVGDDIYLSIESGLEYSRSLALFISSNALKSNWVDLERSTALFRDPTNKIRRFIPIVIDGCDIPDTLRRYRYLDFRNDQEKRIAELIEICRPLAKPQATKAKATSELVAKNVIQMHDAIDEFPREVQRILRNGEKCEIKGEVWDAAGCFKEASQILKNSGLGDARQIEALEQRERVNQELGEQLRMKYRGKPGPALIKVFDESNVLQRTATKLEVHSDAGLIHHTALLLVRDGDGRVIYYRRRPQQTYPGRFDFFGGHTADVDGCPLDTARREANEELHLSLNDKRLRIADEWIHQIGEEYQFVWHAPRDREKSTLFVVTLPSHPALKVRLTDEAADGIQLLKIPKYETALFQRLVSDYLSGVKEFASGAERVLIAYDRDPDIKRHIDSWFMTNDLASS